MSTDKSKTLVPIYDRKSGEVRMSAPIAVHTATPIASRNTSASDTVKGDVGERSEVINEAADSGVSAVSSEPNTSTLAAAESAPADPVPTNPTAVESSFPQVTEQGETHLSGDSGRKPSVSDKAKVDIETLEQFIVYAYGRKGQRLSLKAKTERLIAQNPILDEETENRLHRLADADLLLAVPRQLLLASRELQGVPVLRSALNAFVSKVILRHPIFSDEGLRAAVHNLPDAPSMSEALAQLKLSKKVEFKEKPKLKLTDIEALHRNAVYLLVTWFACNRGITLEEVTNLLFNALWSPAERELTDDDARLRALTEMEQSAGVGLACGRFRKQAIESRAMQEQAQRAAELLRTQFDDADELLRQEKQQSKTLGAQLEALRNSSTTELAELRAQHEAIQMHLRHELEQLRGRLVRRLEDSVEMLGVGLTALRNKAPRTEVMAERAEHVVDALRAELANLSKGE
jgi:hypothetical protein